jgi:hypothetical protein
VSNPPEQKAKEPHWAFRIVDECQEFLVTVDDVLVMSLEGLIKSRKVRPADYLFKSDEEGDEYMKAWLGDLGNWERLQGELDDERRRGAFSDKEFASDFPTVRGHTLVTIWAALDGFVRNLAIAFLVNEPKTLRRAEFSRIKIRAVDFERLSLEDRMIVVFEEFTRTIASSGLSRFDSILRAIGLPDADFKEPDLGRNLHELRFVRNYIVHCNGIADQRFVDACPAFNVKSGSKIAVGPTAYNRYFEASKSFVRSVRARLAKFSFSDQNI